MAAGAMSVTERVRGPAAASRRARAARRGFTLVETLVGVMLIAVVVTSVFSLVLTARMTSVKSERRGQAVLYQRRVLEALKPYVRADPSAPGPTASWRLPGDTVNGWALAAGGHDVSSWLSSKFCSLDPSNCKLTYTVVDTPSGCDTDKTCMKQVSVNITYKDVSQ